MTNYVDQNIDLCQRCKCALKPESFQDDQICLRVGKRDGGDLDYADEYDKDDDDDDDDDIFV